MRADPTNAEIADELAAFAALLELADSSSFAVRAYVRGAELVRATPMPIAELVRNGRVRELRGIGSGIEARLRELIETGEIAELRALRAEIRPELVAYGRLLGVSATRMLGIARDLDLRTVVEFREAARTGRLQEARGVGPATESTILAALAAPPRARRGLTINRARALADSIAVALGGEAAGSSRRYCELTPELHVVCASTDTAAMIARFAALPMIAALIASDERGAVGLTVEGIPVTLVGARPEAFGTELVRATGSDDYVLGLEPLPQATSEENVFALLGVEFCPPELREEAGAVVPVGLIGRADVRGDLHCHTRWSDGKATVHEMALAARRRGYDYIAICDHTPNVGVVPGLNSDDLRRQGEEIAQVNELLAPFRVLRGVECDIRADGTLDVEDRVLDELDWVQLSLHAGQRRGRSELTRLVTEAMRHPAVRALSHPKGRILNRRPENALDLDEVFTVALETGVALEVNGLPDRLDLSARHARAALAAGVDLVLNSDAHSARGLENLDLALATARKAGATVGAVVNARPVVEVASGQTRIAAPCSGVNR